MKLEIMLIGILIFKSVLKRYHTRTKKDEGCHRGIKPKWFAPQIEVSIQVTVQVGNELNMKTILWTVDTVDWKKLSTSEMVRHILTNVDNGSMVLMYPLMPVAEGL